MALPEDNSPVIRDDPPVTLEGIAVRLDSIGAQMDWLCENLQSLFQFVNAMGNSGGGIRGLLSAMKNGPDLNVPIPVEAQDKVGE